MVSEFSCMGWDAGMYVNAVPWHLPCLDPMFLHTFAPFPETAICRIREQGLDIEGERHRRP